MAIDLRFARAEEVEVGTVDEEDVLRHDVVADWVTGN